MASENCIYIPVISAEFGKVIGDAEIDHEFQEIERVFTCYAEVIGEDINDEDITHDYGVIDNSHTIDASYGIIQYMKVQGDTDITLADPAESDPKLITLVIGNVGSVANDTYAKINFLSGTAWSNDRDDPMDGKPWNMYANTDGSTSGTQYAGMYGCIVQCIHDGVGWVHLIWGRHHLDVAGTPNPDDIYDWR